MPISTTSNVHFRPGGGGSLGAYPANSTNTGFQNAPGYPGGTSDIAGTALTDGSAISITSGTTYQYYKNLTYSPAVGWEIGTPSVPVHDVTFTGCLWETTGANTGALLLCADGPVTFDHCTVRGTAATPPVPTQADGYQYGIVADGTQAAPGTYNTFCQQLTIRNCDIWGFSNATKISGSSQSWPLLYDTCWFHDLRPNDNALDHQDGPGCPGSGTGSYITFNRCTIEALGDTQGLAFQDGVPIVNGLWSHMTITDNLFGGFGNFVYIGYGASYITFTGNTWSTRLHCYYSPLYDPAQFIGSAGTLWRNNKWYVPSGADYGKPEYSGYYWLPAGANLSGYSPVNDELAMGLVSTTDYAG